jgi:hypothetical protein
LFNYCYTFKQHKKGSKQVTESKKEIVVKPPVISEKTMNEMKEFFMKTSIPRIIAEEQSKQK